MTAWIDDTEKFTHLATRGHAFQRALHKTLLKQGLPAELPVLSIRKSVADIHLYEQEHDLICLGKRIEVKGRGLKFTCAADFPYDTVLVDTVKKFDRKNPRPDAYVFISERKPWHFIVLSVGKTMHAWKKIERRDNVRGFVEMFYACPRELCRDGSALINSLKKIQRSMS